MATPKKLDFSSSNGPCNSDDTLSRRKSPRNPSSKRPASVTAAETEEAATKKKKLSKKKKNKSGSSIINRIWNEEDELIVLKGLVDYRAKIRSETKADWDECYRFVGGSIVARFSKEQFLSKIRKLKRRFLVHLEKINQGQDPKFTRSSDSEAFGFCMMIWGPSDVDDVSNDDDDDDDDDDGVDKEMVKEVARITENAEQSENGEEMLKEVEEVANAETENGNGMQNGVGNDEEMLKEVEEVANVETVNGNGTESHEDDDEDELCAVRDAFETMMTQGLSDYQKKLLLENLMNLGSGKRKELSDEWKALCVEERRLIVMKLRFSAKLADAASNEMID